MNDLRDRIAEALIDDFRQRHGEPDQIIRAAKHRTAALAMAEAQPVLDAKDAEIRNLAALADIIERIPESHVTLGDVAMSGGDKCVPWCVPCLRQRAEDAERALAEKAAEVDDKSDVGHAVAQAWQQRAEDAERELAALRTHQQTGDL